MFDLLRARLAPRDAQHPVTGCERRRLSRVHAQKLFDSFGAHAPAHPPAPLLRAWVHMGIEVVHLGDISAEALQEDYHHAWIEGAADGLLQIVDPVGGNAAGISGGVAAVVDDATAQPAVRRPRANHGNVGIGRSGRLYDFRIALSRMRPAQAVLHAEAAVVGYVVLYPSTEARARRRAAGVGCRDRFHDCALHLFQVCRIRGGRFLVRQLPHQRRGVIVLAGLHHASRPGGVRVRGAHHHSLGRDPATLPDLAPRR